MGEYADNEGDSISVRKQIIYGYKTVLSFYFNALYLIRYRAPTMMTQSGEITMMDTIGRDDNWRAPGDNQQWPNQELPRSRPDN